MKDFLQKLHTWYMSQNLIIKYFQIVLFNINLPQYYITIELFIHIWHYIKYVLSPFNLTLTRQVFLYNFKSP
jgi:hypothetical protein